MVYKVIRKFVHEGELLKNGMYVDLEPEKVKLRHRRGCLLMARDQKGAKKLLGIDKPIKFNEEEKKDKPKKVIKKKVNKNVKEFE